MLKPGNHSRVNTGVHLLWYAGLSAWPMSNPVQICSSFPGSFLDLTFVPHPIRNLLMVTQKILLYSSIWRIQKGERNYTASDVGLKLLGTFGTPLTTS